MDELGTMAKVSRALEASDRALTMSELMAAADISKTSAAEVSSVLSKLRNRGLLVVESGQTTAPRGRKFVRKYRWRAKPLPKADRRDAGPFDGLGGLRIGRLG